MADMVASSPSYPLHPVDRVLQRLLALHPKLIDLSLGRIERLLARLGHPERRLPPVIHAAGTNGKGSTLAFISAIASAHNLRVHRYTSPHLIRFNERIALAGDPGIPSQPIDDDQLLDLLDQVEAANGGEPITFFEVTTAAALLAFSETPADLVLLETGLGGRVDATNVVDQPAVTVITPIGMDHMGFLGDTLAAIAGEKAGIIKPKRPVVLAPQPPEALAVLQQVAADQAAPVIPLAPLGDMPVGLSGDHQRINARAAATAFSVWADQHAVKQDQTQIATGLANTTWPARLQPLTLGDFGLPDDGRPVWLDGAHNPEGMAALMAAWQGLTQHDPPGDLILGVMANKDSRGILRAIGHRDIAARFERVIAVPVPDTPNGLPPTDLAAALADYLPADTVISHDDTPLAALTTLAHGPKRPLLIAGSLYLAGSLLAARHSSEKRLPLIGV
ncbi:MAG: folylpolyglutamate synthase/dihydrofolate synthase family protein [Pseudomonadota bacterium]